MTKISNSNTSEIKRSLPAPDGIEVSVFYSSKISKGVVVSSDLAVTLAEKHVILSIKELPSVKLLLRNKYLHSYFFRIEDVLNYLNVLKYLPDIYTEYLNVHGKPLTLKQSVIVPDDVLSDSTDGWLFPVRSNLFTLYFPH